MKNSKILLITILLLFSFFYDSGCSGHKSDQSVIRPVSGTGQDQETPVLSIHEAALNGQINVVQAHLEKGTDVNLIDEEGRTALMYAAYNGHTETIRKLLEKGAGLNIQDPYGRSALMMASSGPYPQTVKILLDKGADPNLTDKDEHFTALMYAAAEGQLEVVKLLLAYKADPLMKDIDGDNAATFAANNGHKEVAEIINSVTK